MTQSYSTEIIAQELHALELPDTDFLARALVALITGRKASIHQLANLMPGEASQEAKRQQFRRFLDKPSLRGECWAKALAAMLPVPKPWIVAIDRTQWKVGEQPVNLLVLAVVCQGCAVPLLWTPLEKAGASDTKERIALVKRFLTLFGAQAIRFVTADREFIGGDWIEWLLEKQIAFRIRIKAGEWLLAQRASGRGWTGEAGRTMVCCACLHLSQEGDVVVGSAGLCRRKAPVGGQKPGTRASTGDLIVVSNQPGDLLEEYRQRWKIETLFQAFKGRGFDVESTRLVEPVRWLSFWGFLSLALCWCLRVGAFLERGEPTRLKKHGRRAQSTFHRGVTHLQSLLAPLCGRACLARFMAAVKQLRLEAPIGALVPQLN